MGETVDSVAGSQASPADQSSGPGRWSKKPVGSLIRVVPRLFLWIAVAEGVLVAVVMAVAVAGITVSVIMAVTDTRPSLIDDLRAGRVTSRDVTSAAILKFDPGAGWPGREESYAAKARHRLRPAEWSALLRLLAMSTTDGSPSRNHPESFYDSILLIDLGDKGHYYVFCSHGCYQELHYVVINTTALS